MTYRTDENLVPNQSSAFVSFDSRRTDPGPRLNLRNCSLPAQTEDEGTGGCDRAVVAGYQGEKTVQHEQLLLSRDQASHQRNAREGMTAEVALAVPGLSFSNALEEREATRSQQSFSFKAVLEWQGKGACDWIYQDCKREVATVEARVEPGRGGTSSSVDGEERQNLRRNARRADSEKA